MPLEIEACWKDSGFAGWLVGSLVGWFAGSLVGWLAGSAASPRGGRRGRVRCAGACSNFQGLLLPELFLITYVNQRRSDLQLQETADCADSVRFMGTLVASPVACQIFQNLKTTENTECTDVDPSLIQRRCKHFRSRLPILLSVYSVFFGGYRVPVSICVNLRNLRFLVTAGPSAADSLR